MKSTVMDSPNAASPLATMLAGFINMFSVGTMYALSTVQNQIPRTMSISGPWTYAPFAAASIGLAIGVGTCAMSIAQVGAVATIARGTAVWGGGLALGGFLFSYETYHYMLVSICLGAIGVGWTYLGVIVMMGERFPAQPLARSVIGPLGFASGSAAWFALASIAKFGSKNATEIGAALELGGVCFIVVAIATAVALPTGSPKKENSSSGISWSHTRQLSVVLFLNALPGMVVFCNLVPATEQLLAAHGTHQLPCSMIALFGGGLIAPHIRGLAGTKGSFAFLFSFRSAVLAAYVRFPSPATATACLVIVLFAHGAGFSILPELVKEASRDKSLAASSYGLTLVAWGLSGVVAAAINAFCFTDAEGTKLAGSILCAITAGAAGLVLFGYGFGG